MTINKRQGGRGNIPTLMKELKFILNQMWSKDPFLYIIVILNSIINGVLPFIWIFAPAYVIDNKDKKLGFFYSIFYKIIYPNVFNEILKLVLNWQLQDENE